MAHCAYMWMVKCAMGEWSDKVLVRRAFGAGRPERIDGD